MTNEEVRGLFPAALGSTYLNSAAMAPVPTSAVEAVSSQLNDVANHGIKNFFEWRETRERVRARIASMLCVKPGEIAFLRTTSDGIGAVAASLDWQAGDNVVSFAGEFPSNYYPWRKVKDDHGIEFRLCPPTNGRIDIDQLLSLIDHRTRVVAVAAVQFDTGFRLDLERVGRAAREHDALLCVDMIQVFGAMPLDLPSMYVDVASGGSYKWLCAPEGCGIFYVSERVRDRVRPLTRGWTSVANFFDFEDRDQPMTEDASAWETGLIGSAMYYGLEQSLELLNKSGVDRIANYLEELTDYLCESIPSDRYRVYSSRTPGEKSQIVSLLPMNGSTSDQIAERLAREGIIVSARGDLVRVAPHFFNNSEDIERMVAAL